ncbi:MAG: type I DNA topoisomerase [Candidatus Levybacteria bacterium]|nr:type I DNA topoisomerase [Candidatus Levybacteria bacterium]
MLSIMNLVIVESPTKARTIGRFLGEGYEIKASMGHIMDLPKSTLAVDVEHDFSPQYELVEDKKKIISELKTAAKSAKQIILATDPDREGEAIAYHISELISNQSLEPSEKKSRLQPLASKKLIQRIVFHEITKEAIEEALKNPRVINKSLVDAQTARRVLDRLVGYKLSPLLWQKVRRGLSAGRVQSVSLRLIVEREREIEKFKKEEYWTITVLLAGPAARSSKGARSSLSFGTERTARLWTPPLASPAGDVAEAPRATEFELVEINGEKIEVQEAHNLYDGEYKVTKTIIGKEERAKEIERDLKTKQFIVADVLQKEVHRSPAPPYTTSTLQQDAARRLGFFGKRTMRAAQKLYEEGFITYHRTDSVNVANTAIFAMRGFIKKQYGEKFLPEKPRFYKTKQKLAQEAHEGIRPTNIRVQTSDIRSQMGNDAPKLYELIWRRAVASQMADAIIESTTVIVDSQIQNSKFVFEGFLKANPQALDDKKLPEFKVSESLNLLNINAEKHETPPPPRYNEASLIKTLEEKGIGRPSTYAMIISTIEERQYVERDPSTGSGQRLTPTPVGIAVNDFLVKYFSTIDDIPFTAEMEDELDNIAHGKREWVPVIAQFYKPFEKTVEKVKEDAKRVKIEVEKTDEKCPECKSNLVVRIGRFGKFISCGSFPKCKFSKPFVEKTGLKCPKDAGEIIVKKTRKGRKFFGCSNYPACDYATWKLESMKKTLV